MQPNYANLVIKDNKLIGQRCTDFASITFRKIGRQLQAAKCWQILVKYTAIAVL